MHAGKDAHRHLARIVANEHFIDFQNRAELLIERLSGYVREIEIDLVLAIHSEAIETDLKNLAGGDVPRHQIPVRRIFFFEEIKALFFRN